MKNRAKRILSAVLLLALLVVLFPISIRYKDGGSVGYRSILCLYEVRDWHQMAPLEQGGYIEGWTVEILGKEIYNNTYVTK